MAREAGGPSYAKAQFQQADSLLQQAVSLQEKETFDEATRIALQAQTVAKDARTTATAKGEQIRTQRRKEEKVAQVKDTILRTQRARDSLDEFSRRASSKQLESVEGLLRLADLLLQEDKADLALVNAERAEALVQEAAQHAKDAQATEMDVLDKAKNIENVQTLATNRGAVLRITGDLFPVGRSDLNKEFRPLITRLAQILRPHVGKYRVAVEGHTDRSGNSDTNLLLSKGRAATIARYLMEDLGPSAQVVSEGYGDTQPIPDLAPSNAKNRRVEILLLTRFRP
jgi:flagellar motor protein MotB